MERRITIEEEVVYKADYQMRMLEANEIEGLLGIRGRGMNGRSCYDYNVSGKTSIKAMYERSEISAKDIKKFLEELRNIIQNVSKYLLNIHCILLDPEYIFYEDEKFYFCYYPPKTTELWEDVHKLAEYFVKRADYKDQECVKIVFLLHKETMAENYSLDKIIEACMHQETDTDELPERRERSKREEDMDIVYDSADHDWIAEQEMGAHIMEATDHMWTPVKRFLRRHKKPRWGEWDGLHIEEEEL